MRYFGDYEDPPSTISKALALDADLIAWGSEFQLEHTFGSVTVEEPTEAVYSKCYHIYSDIWAAAFWNHYRSLRLLVLEIAVDQMNYLIESTPTLLSQYENQLCTSKANLMAVSHDICASVPFYLGQHLSGECRTSSDQLPHAVGGTLLLWPLYSAGQLNQSTNMRMWVIGRMEHLADLLGIRQAAIIAQALREQQEITVWATEDSESGLEVESAKPLVLLEKRGYIET